MNFPIKWPHCFPSHSGDWKVKNTKESWNHSVSLCVWGLHTDENWAITFECVFGLNSFWWWMCVRRRGFSFFSFSRALKGMKRIEEKVKSGDSRRIGKSWCWWLIKAVLSPSVCLCDVKSLVRSLTLHWNRFRTHARTFPPFPAAHIYNARNSFSLSVNQLQIESHDETRNFRHLTVYRCDSDTQLRDESLSLFHAHQCAHTSKAVLHDVCALFEYPLTRKTVMLVEIKPIRMKIHAEPTPWRRAFIKIEFSIFSLISYFITDANKDTHISLLFSSWNIFLFWL